MKPALITIALLCACNLCIVNTHAQFSVDTKIEDLYRLNIISPGISLEKKIFEFSTIQANVFWNTTVNAVQNSNTENKKYIVFLDPSVNIQYRYYHNYYRRADMGKIVDNNGANFMGGLLERTVTRLPLKGNILTDKARPILKFAAIYGFQRTLFKYVLVESYIGSGYQWETKGLLSEDAGSPKSRFGAFTIFGQLNIGIPVL